VIKSKLVIVNSAGVYTTEATLDDNGDLTVDRDALEMMYRETRSRSLGTART